MNEHALPVIIVLIPRDARGDEHMTLVTAGEIGSTISAPRSTMAEVSNRLAMMFNPFGAAVIGNEMFGDRADTPVATLASPMLDTMRHCVEHFHNSQWGFRPHITKVGPTVRPVGSTVWFNRVALWYGQDQESWVLGRSYGTIRSIR